MGPIWGIKLDANMVILSHFLLKNSALIWVAPNRMTPVLSLEFGGSFFFFLLVFSFRQSQCSFELFLGWHQKMVGNFGIRLLWGKNLPTTNFWMGWIFEPFVCVSKNGEFFPIFWTSRMGPDLNDARVSKIPGGWNVWRYPSRKIFNHRMDGYRNLNVYNTLVSKTLPKQVHPQN